VLGSAAGNGNRARGAADGRVFPGGCFWSAPKPSGGYAPLESGCPCRYYLSGVAKVNQGQRSSNTFEPGAVEKALDILLRALPAVPLPRTGIPDRDRKKLWKRIQTAIERLSAVNVELDLIALPPLIYNPADPLTFAESIANKLLLQDPMPLEDFRGRKFYGSGVYALFYRGDFDLYRPIKDARTPIYVGKAIPGKPKRDPTSTDAEIGLNTPRQQGPALWKRLVEHVDSIQEVNNLRLSDFNCRYLVTASGWQFAAEDHLIALFRPVWNKETRILSGFGKHGDSHQTRINSRSFWDTLHPGRLWATREGNVPNEKTVQQIRADVVEHFRRFPPRK